MLPFTEVRGPWTSLHPLLLGSPHRARRASAFPDPAGTETTQFTQGGAERKREEPSLGWVSSLPESGSSDWAQGGEANGGPASSSWAQVLPW